MKYSRFELLVLIFGGGAIVGTAAASVARQAGWTEVVGQLLLLVVLIGALRWGRKGGFAAGLIATFIYIGIRAPTIMVDGSLTPALVQLLVTRAIVFGGVGIVGGELCTRIKYLFLRLENSGHIDEVTNLYSATYMQELLRSHIGQWDRYRACFSVVTLRLDEARIPPLTKAQGRRVLRDTGSAVLGDIRLVDEMGRLDGAQFCIILPNTPLDGAKICAARLMKTAARALNAKTAERDGIASADALGYPEDEETIKALLPPLEETPDRRAT